MTKVSPACEDQIQMKPVLPVSVDVSFASNQFPNYKLGANNQILEEVQEEAKGPSLKEVVAQESTQLVEQQKRLSVRDLATKFDKNLAAAAKLSDEAKLKDAGSLEGLVLLMKLRDALESLRGRLTGQKKEDVEKAISMVEALAVKLTQGEGELIQEKFEVKRLANFLKQASEDAKRLINQERSFACAEIESARAVVQRFGLALEEKGKKTGEQVADVEELLEEIQEARKIKMLHHPIKVMDMEHELRALRIQIQEKSVFSVKLQKELTLNRRVEENKSRAYQVHGCEALGSYLKVQRCSDMVPELSRCSIQWYRVSSEGSKKELISGATKSTYAPEPMDVGQTLQADIIANGQSTTATTVGPINPAAGGLESYVETLLRKPNAEFNVFISQLNGQDYPSRSVNVLHVGKMRMKLCRGWITKARESYSSSMQLCGARGDGNTAAKALFWQSRKRVSYVLAFESERDRNAAIMLARRYASDCNVKLAVRDD